MLSDVQLQTVAVIPPDLMHCIQLHSLLSIQISGKHVGRENSAKTADIQTETEAHHR